VTAQALEQSVLESKDKAQLVQIAEALGVKTTARNKKADIIDQILAKTGGSDAEAEAPAPAPAPARKSAAARSRSDAPIDTPATEPAADVADEPKAEWEVELETSVGSTDTPADRPDQGGAASADSKPPADAKSGDAKSSDAKPGDGQQGGPRRDSGDQRGDRPQRNAGGRNQNNQNRNQGGGNQGGGNEDGEGRNKRRRRRRKGRGGQDGPQGEDLALLEIDEGTSAPVSNEPVEIEGYLDIRDEGYGFVRVNKYLATKSDSYVPVKLSRQFGLRKGDHVVGMSRPAGRNEKNPAMLEIHKINGRSPEDAKKRNRFEDLTALFPDSPLRMEDPSEPANMTARIIDLVSPIGKGQRGIIVSPPKAGKTTVMKTIAASIEKNNPECKLIVLLIDERPEEVTDMKRMVKGEVIASTFDRPSDEHTQIAEMCIEKAKRMVEYGEDVVVILDGITRLARAYNLAAPASGRILSGGIDAGALYPPKKFFGAARNIEEGGSLTILATALVETNSRMDEAVFEEFKGTGNMELRLDRKLAERRIYPAIDVDASSTRHEELLYDRKQLQMVWKLRRVLSGLAADGNAAPGLELLVDRLKTFRTNEEFLTEIAKQPGM
jgi:transcription termination factor Rho